MLFLMPFKKRDIFLNLGILLLKRVYFSVRPIDMPFGCRRIMLYLYQRMSPMTMSFGIGKSQHQDIKKAFIEAMNDSVSGLEDNYADACLFFLSANYDPFELEDYLTTLTEKGTKIIGCTTTGIITDDSILTNGMAVLSIKSNQIHFGVSGLEHPERDDIRHAGNLLAQQSLKYYGMQTRSAFLSLTDGNIANISPLLQGVQEVLGYAFPIIGGGSCDDFQFQSTYQIIDNKVTKNSAVGLLFGGNIQVGVGASHGWRPLGKPRYVTAVENNVIKTIDNLPASHIYVNYFGMDTNRLHEGHLGQASILYPLGFFVEETGEYLIRKVSKINANGDIVCQGDIPLGGEIHLMIGNKEACKNAVLEAAREAKTNMLGKKPQLIFVFESMARLKLFGRKAIEEVQIIKKIFDPDIPIFGIYTNGEICPMQTKENIKKPFLQNQSIMIMAIGDK